MNHYTDIRPLAQPDVYAAMYAFALTFGLPPLDPANVIRGWQNRGHLPPETNEYVVLTVMQHQRCGTNVTTVPDAQGGFVTAELVRCGVQMDFCASNETARQRAQTIELAGRSPLAVAALGPYGITPLFADDVRDLSFVDGSEQYVQRFMATLHITYWAVLPATVEYFTQVGSYLENVDVHHPVTD